MSAQIHIKFQGKVYFLDIEEGFKAFTYGQLQSQVEILVSVPKDAQRLFYKGKKIKVENSTTMLEEIFENESNSSAIQLLLIAGALKKDVDKMNSIQKSVLIEEKIRAKRKVLSIAAKNELLEAQSLVSSSYRFHDIQVLQNFPDHQKARDILYRLATDKGILAVMEKHKWSVGALAEMYPDGKVGVDPVCVLGLNQNKGQKILLRLRTDDLKGFRKYLTIKKVLFHELSHNVFSEHDNDFYQLMRQVEKECQELDWTNTRGFATTRDTIMEDVMNPIRLNDGSNVQGGSYQLGGNIHRNRLLELDTPITPAARPEIIVSPTEVAVAVKVAASTTTTYEATADDVAMKTVEPSVGIDSKRPPVSEEQVNLPQLQFEALSEAIVTLQSFGGSERELRIQYSLRKLEAYNERKVSVIKALELLHKIISNIVQHPQEPKYHSIRKTNKLFVTNVSCFPECLEFLQAIGFEEQMESFVLTRNDPVLLYMGKSSLEVVLPSIVVCV